MSTERKLVFIRHLATENNRNGVIMGRVIDAEIVRDQQVDDFVQRISSMHDILSESEESGIAMFTSPLIRCKQTAELISQQFKYNKPQIMELPQLIETDMGEFSGKRGNELRGKYGEMVDDWMYNPSKFRFPDGESYEEVRQRVLSVLQRFKNLDNRLVFAITHVDIIKMVILEALQSSFDNRRYFSIPNGSVSVLLMDTKGKLQLTGINIYPSFNW